MVKDLSGRFYNMYIESSPNPQLLKKEWTQRIRETINRVSNLENVTVLMLSVVKRCVLTRL